MWISGGASADLRPGQVRAVAEGRREIVVCRTPDGRVRAVRGICPHRGAPLRFGRLAGLVVSEHSGEYRLEREVVVLRCPWHSFEYDVATGTAVADPSFRVQTYPVREEDGQILVEV